MSPWQVGILGAFFSKLSGFLGLDILKVTTKLPFTGWIRESPAS